MEELFLKLLNMSISAGWMVLAIVILRGFIKKMPKAVRCVLWALVAVRLVIPITWESGLSLIPSAQTIPQDILYATEPTIHSGISFVNSYVNPVISESLAPTVGDSVNPLQVITFVVSWVWLIGIFAMFLYVIYSYLRIRGRVSASIPVKENIYICDDIAAPFILGVIKPRIYLPSDLEQDISTYAIAHEKAHIRRHDHWWKPLGFLLLSLYWYNPVLWVAYVLFSRDIELACDEKVIKELGEMEKKPYSEALLQCSVSRKMISACPLAFGEVGVKERVRNVLVYKKPTFWALSGASLICVIVSVCFLSNPREVQELPQGTYTSKECLYMNLLSSYLPINGASGQIYYVEENLFVLKNLSSGIEHRMELESLEWKEFPYTDEEWRALYAFELDERVIENISELCESIGYIELEEGYCLLRMNKAIWLVKIYHDGVAGMDYIWSIYRIERENATSEEEIPYIK
ncbi:MAG: hypothetical protein IJ326_02890 [Lachnospiraceae bacterium]|nr:hypothetical protein [Lachnospiraceae bacterium]